LSNTHLLCKYRLALRPGPQSLSGNGCQRTGPSVFVRLLLRILSSQQKQTFHNYLYGEY
jgi:hypothetical protein